PQNRAWSRSPARRCFAAACARCAPSRTCRSRRPRAGSSLLPHQMDEDVLERVLRGLDIAEPDAGPTEVLRDRGDAGAPAPGFIAVGEVASVGRERKAGAGELVRNGSQWLLQMQREVLLAELSHQLGLVLDQDDLAMIDDADAVGHLLRFLDVMRGQDD